MKNYLVAVCRGGSVCSTQIQMEDDYIPITDDDMKILKRKVFYKLKPKWQDEEGIFNFGRVPEDICIEHLRIIAISNMGV